MAFSYIPGAGAKDDVRLLIGDVDATAIEAQRLEDEDIARLLVLEGNTYRAAAQAADVLAAKFARLGEGSQAPNNPGSSRAAELRATASRLRARASSAAVPFAGGVSIEDKAAREADTDRPTPAFRLGMMDSP